MRAKLYTPIVCLLLLMVTGCSTSANSSNSGVSDNLPEQHWLTSNVSQKTVDIKLVANYNGNDGGMNFDGYSNGDMTITVPQGWKVRFLFSNASSMTVHSAMVVPYNERTHSSFSSSMLAFPGASTPSPTLGTQSGQKQTFTFTANKAGKYAIVCAIPEHAVMGMWDTLVVSNSARQSSFAIK